VRNNEVIRNHAAFTWSVANLLQWAEATTGADLWDPTVASSAVGPK